MKYGILLLEHFRHPKQVGQIPAAPNVYKAEAAIPGGDKVQLFIQVSPQGIIDDIKYQVQGCPSTIACMSWMASELLGQPVEDARHLTPGQIKAGISVPTPKSRCALLASQVLQKTLLEIK